MYRLKKNSWWWLYRIGPNSLVDYYERIAGSCCLRLQVEAAGTCAKLAHINQTVRHHNGEEWCCGTALISG